MYHIIFAMRYGAEFPSADDQDGWIACCGDPNTPMHFKIERGRGKTWTAGQDIQKK